METAVIHGSEFAVGNAFLCHLVESVVHHHVVNRKRKFLFLCNGNHLFGVSNAGGNRFFNNDVFSGFKSADGHFSVSGVVGGNINGINLRIGNQRIHRVIPFESQSFCGTFARRIEVKSSGQLRILQRSEPGLVTSITFFGDTVFGNTAESDDRVFDFSHDRPLFLTSCKLRQPS